MILVRRVFELVLYGFYPVIEVVCSFYGVMVRIFKPDKVRKNCVAENYANRFFAVFVFVRMAQVIRILKISSEIP